MTSKVAITAHCSKDKEVIVLIYSGLGSTETHILQDQENREFYIYDDRSIETFERIK